MSSRIIIVALFLFGALACNKKTFFSDKYVNLHLLQIIQNDDKYDGRKINLRGYLSYNLLEGEDFILVPTMEDYFDIEYDHVKVFLYSAFDLSKCVGEYVSVYGTFYNTQHGERKIHVDSVIAQLRIKPLEARKLKLTQQEDKRKHASCNRENQFNN